ncbi:MAG: hypothetical protein K2Y23_23385 [Cyanobacteria bacterium]|nr:hypothetical protein [Cyanobacteriota bacterium]
MGTFEQRLPAVPAGKYALFADLVHGTGLLETLTAELDTAAVSGELLIGDDSAWSADQQSTTTKISWVRDNTPLVPKRLMTFTPISDFIQQGPDESQPATEKSEAWILFDEVNRCISARATGTAIPSAKSSTSCAATTATSSATRTSRSRSRRRDSSGFNGMYVRQRAGRSVGTAPPASMSNAQFPPFSLIRSTKWRLWFSAAAPRVRPQRYCSRSGAMRSS